MVLIISGASERRLDATQFSDEIEDQSRRLSKRVRELEGEGLDAKVALKKAARELGIKRAEAYRLVVAQKNRRRK